MLSYPEVTPTSRAASSHVVITESRGSGDVQWYKVHTKFREN
jgi:hypothetical protein